MNRKIDRKQLTAGKRPAQPLSPLAFAVALAAVLAWPGSAALASDKAGIADHGTRLKTNSGRAAGVVPSDVNGDGRADRTAGTPIQGTPIGLEGDPGSLKLSATTDRNGAFQFAGLPAGKYRLVLSGGPAESVTVGANGTITGNVVGSGTGQSGAARVFRITNVRGNATAAAGTGVNRSR
jgi:hypothetical protein